MKRLKRFLISICLNKTQRRIIWQAIVFSEYTYRCRGNVDEATTVKTVMNDTEELFDVVKRTYTKEEVDMIVEKAVRDSLSEAEARVKVAYKVQQPIPEGEMTSISIENEGTEAKSESYDK